MNNESIAAAKPGLRTGILCFLGEDPPGIMIRNALLAAGVATDLIVSSNNHATPVTTMFVKEDGTRKSITNQAHRYNFHPEKHSACFSRSKAILLSSLFQAPFDDPEIIYSVLRDAAFLSSFEPPASIR